MVGLQWKIPFNWMMSGGPPISGNLQFVMVNPLVHLMEPATAWLSGYVIHGTITRSLVIEVNIYQHGLYGSSTLSLSLSTYIYIYLYTLYSLYTYHYIKLYIYTHTHIMINISYIYIYTPTYLYIVSQWWIITACRNPAFGCEEQQDWPDCRQVSFAPMIGDDLRGGIESLIVSMRLSQFIKCGQNSFINQPWLGVYSHTTHRKLGLRRMV